MSIQTRAAVLRSPSGAHQLESVTLAGLGPHDVLVRIAGVGFCHTDMAPRGMGTQMLPVILGHEGSGHVVEVGSEVNGISVGDAVVLSFASCGRCSSCRDGAPAYCLSFMGLNMTGRDLLGGTSATDAGGEPVANRWFGQSSFAEHAIVNERGVVVVGRDVPIELMGPLGCGLQTGAGAVLNEMKLKKGQSIAVFGVGAVGLAAVMAAKIAGAGDIIAVDLHRGRLKLAKELGATRTVHAAGDMIAAVRGHSEGPDFALDTTAVGDIMKTAIESLRTGGTAVLAGASLDELILHPSELAGKKVTFVLEGSSNPQTFIPTLIHHWRAGRFPFEKLISTFPIDEISVAEAKAQTGDVVKPVLLVG